MQFSDGLQSHAPQVELSAVHIVNSLICYPNHFGDVGYVRFEVYIFITICYGSYLRNTRELRVFDCHWKRWVYAIYVRKN